MITLKEIEENETFNNFIVFCQKQLDELGYTEHSTRHAKLVAINTGKILKDLGYEESIVNLGQIAGYIHDIGNSVNRVDHAHTGAILAYNELIKMGMGIQDASEIMMAIGNHDEQTGMPVSVLSAALILADKADVHRSRVRNNDKTTFDIHDRVNYSVEKSEITVDKEKNKVILSLQIDTTVTQLMDYFEIFTYRMIMCKKAAKYLGIRFELLMNENKILE